MYSCHSDIRVTPFVASSAWIVAKSGGGYRGGTGERGYNLASRRASSSSGGNGHPAPAARARRRHSCTVQRAAPIVAAITTSRRPASALSRCISRILRTGNVASATVDPLGSSPKGSR